MGQGASMHDGEDPFAPTPNHRRRAARRSSFPGIGTSAMHESQTATTDGARRRYPSAIDEGSDESGSAGSTRISTISRLRHTLRGARSASMSRIDVDDRRRYHHQRQQRNINRTNSTFRSFRRHARDSDRESEEEPRVETPTAAAEVQEEEERPRTIRNNDYPADPPSLMGMETEEFYDDDESSSHKDSFLNTTTRDGSRGGSKNTYDNNKQQQRGDTDEEEGLNTPQHVSRISEFRGSGVPLPVSPPSRNSLTDSSSRTVYRQSSIASGDSMNYSPGSLYSRAIYNLSTQPDFSAGYPQEEDEYVEFYPPTSRDYEWMGRSIESLILGHRTPAPVLALHESLDEETEWFDCTSYRRRSTASTFGGGRRSSQGSFPGGRRGSLSLSGNFHGGTLANYYSQASRRRTLQQQTGNDYDRSYISFDHRRSSISSSNQPMNRRRSSTASTSVHSIQSMNRRRRSATPTVQSIDTTQLSEATATVANVTNGAGNNTGRNRKLGPSVVLSIMARESTGKSCFPRGLPTTQALRSMGGAALFSKLDGPADGMATEVAFLAAAIDAGDWTETQTIVSRISPKLIGNPMEAAAAGVDGRRDTVEDANLPPTAPRFHAGGGRLGLERDAFVLAGGVQVLIRMFREKSFVGQEMASSHDARDLSEEILAKRLASGWNETLVVLRELVFAMPSLVENQTVLDDGEFLPFLFTLLSHDSCFDAAAALIEEILSLMSQAAPQSNNADVGQSDDGASFVPPGGRSFPATTFFLGDVPDLYKLWNGFNCRQLAHFSRILALLVFEPEDRQLWESSTALKSLELLQLRRNRAVRAGRDSTVDMNQSILLGDEELIRRLLCLLKVMNFAPSIRRFSPYHVMAHFPFIADTLVIMGLDEIVNWDEINRQDRLARDLVIGVEEPPLLHELGSVAGMLEGLSETLSNNSTREAQTQIGHILHVLSAAQDAGVVPMVGRDRRGRDTRNNLRPDAGLDGDGEQERTASFASIFASQVLIRQLYETTGLDIGVTNPGLEVPATQNRHINSPEDAANSLQFNGMLLAPCQVEILFVLCTLLGGRRKLDAQNMLNRLGIIGVLDDMFQRLPWYKERASGEEANPEERNRDASHDPEQQVTGIHGPGCDCTPESPLCVQYLRLLHNFCDRDCDNYNGRRLLLSESERSLIFDSPGDRIPKEDVKPGLLTKIVKAFINESDESPYRFWLASCIESYLRGSSPAEQVFVARAGLLSHLIEDVSSERLHCAGSLQTSFDLLGELGKGNSQIFRMLVSDMDEEKFRKLMGVAAANLVDSNVFIRSLLLSLERLTASARQMPLFCDHDGVAREENAWISRSGRSSRSYLTHSWWDMHSWSISSNRFNEDLQNSAKQQDESRPSDWFPSREIVATGDFFVQRSSSLPNGLYESVGYFGWLFSPSGENLSDATFLPNTIERLSWFLATNQARLLRDLLGVVDLRNINHENICCLNTAVVVAIFAHRRQQLSTLLDELRRMNDDEKEVKRRAQHGPRQDDVVDRVFLQAMRYLEMDQQQQDRPAYVRMATIAHNGSQQIGDRTDVMRNFREVLWFWREYYTHRGRDRLSLEFSSRIRFQEWNHVVSLLAADDASATALVNRPVRLPRSPYRRGL